MKKSLKETNPYLQNEDKYYKALAINVLSSTEIETMKYIVCPIQKSKPNKAIEVCEHCKYNKKCKEYQKYLTKREKEVKILNEDNKNIPMFPVESKNIKAVGYNANTRTLRIQFKQGAFYDYFGVPPEIFQQLMVAVSKGTFFGSAIKGKFEFNKIGKVEKED